MIFKPESIGLILEGKKTQTRRPVQAWERIFWADQGALIMPRAATRIDGVIMARPGINRRKWMPGLDYAVCPGRGSREGAIMTNRDKNDLGRWILTCFLVWALMMMVSNGCETNSHLRNISEQLVENAGGPGGAAHPENDPSKEQP